MYNKNHISYRAVFPFGRFRKPILCTVSISPTAVYHGSHIIEELLKNVPRIVPLKQESHTAQQTTI